MIASIKSLLLAFAPMNARSLCVQAEFGDVLHHVQALPQDWQCPNRGVLPANAAQICDGVDRNPLRGQLACTFFINATTTSVGTYPVGSQWRKNPIPMCVSTSQYTPSPGHTCPDLLFPLASNHTLTSSHSLLIASLEPSTTSLRY